MAATGQFTGERGDDAFGAAVGDGWDRFVQRRDECDSHGRFRTRGHGSSHMLFGRPRAMLRMMDLD